MKKILSLILISIMLLSSFSFSFADEVTTAGSKGDAVLQVTYEAPVFSVTVPTTLPASFTSDGVGTFADNVKIINNSFGRVRVTNVEVAAMNGWEIVDFSTDFNKFNVDTKKVAFKINNCKTTGANAIDFIEANFPALSSKNTGDTDEMAINYEVKSSLQSVAVNNAEPMQVVFTIAWDELASGLYQDGVLIASWDELIEDEVLYVNEGVLSSNADLESFTNSSADKLVGKLVIDDSVTSIADYTFGLCTQLTGVEIPNSVETIGEGAFAYSGINNIKIPNSVTSIGKNAFAYSEITSVDLGNGVETIIEGTFYGCTNLTSVTVGNNVKTIEAAAFRECTNLTSVIIPDSVTTIGGSAFSHCTNLTSIEIPDSVTTIGEFAFGYCTNLTSIEIPDSVTTIGEYAFYGCTNLTSIEIPDSVTTIGEFAFGYCTNLTSIEIPDSVTTIGEYAFYGCTNLTSITISSSVESIGDRAFDECTNLTNINVSEGNNTYSSIDGVLFNKAQTELIEYPSGKSSLEIPGSMTVLNDYFSINSNLVTVKLNEGVETIGRNAFQNCHNLTSIEIPDTVTSIGQAAFFECTNLSDVYYTGTQEQWNAITIDKSYISDGLLNAPLLNATIHYESTMPE